MLTAGGTLATAVTPTTSVIPEWKLYPSRNSRNVDSRKILQQQEGRHKRQLEHRGVININD
jgi:hypothetical protein